MSQAEEKQSGNQQPDDSRQSEDDLRAYQYLHFLFYLEGGILFSKDVSARMRRVAKIYFVFIVIYVTGYLGYEIGKTIKERHIDLSNVLEILLMKSTLIFAVILPVTITYYTIQETEFAMRYMKNWDVRSCMKNSLVLNNLGKLMEESLTANSKNINFETDHNTELSHSMDVLLIRRTTLKSSISVRVYIILAGLIIIWYGYSFTQGVLYDGVPNHITHQVLPLPFYDRISSRRQYFIACAITSPVAIMQIIMAPGIVAFIAALVDRMNNIVYDYCKEMQQLSKIIIKYYELKQGMEQASCVNLAEFHYYLEKDLSTLIRHYQDFLKIASAIRPCFNTFSTMIAMGVWSVGITLVVTILEVDLPMEARIRNLIYFIILIPLLYYLCCAGRLFDDMNEAIRDEVYNLPWYYMPPKIRKTVNIFQAMVFNPWEFRYLFLWPISMALFPRVFNSIYSVFNILRTAMKK